MNWLDHGDEVMHDRNKSNLNNIIKIKMNRLIYALTKDAARYSWNDYLDNLDITPEEYKEMKKFWARFNIKPYI